MGADSERRYVLIGAGHRATMFIAALTGRQASAGRLVALADTNAHRMAVHAESVDEAGLPPVTCYDAAQFERMLDEVRPDCLIVTTPDSTHAGYICRALDRGIDVISEKPLTIDEAGLRAICRSVESSRARLTVAFNYRYAPRNTVVKRLIADGAVGDVISVHFEWLLDTAHGADYFRRWHREKDISGGLLVHKSTHHFDLVNWWLDDCPASVYALGGLRFYGGRNAAARGVAPSPTLSRDADPRKDPFRLDMAADPRLRRLYLEAEHLDGYYRDRNVFDEGISIEDALSLTVGYRRGASMSYSLTAFSPWEGYRVAINGTGGRIELEVVERAWVPAPDVSAPGAFVVDPSARADGREAVPPTPVSEGERVLLQKLWQPAVEIPIPEGDGAHGGGDSVMLDDMFFGAADDPLGRAAGYIDGVRSVIVGVAGNASLKERKVVLVGDYGLPLDPASPSAQAPARETR